MAIPNTLRAAQGVWTGDSRLHLPWLEPPDRIVESLSNLTIALDPTGEFARVDYDWIYRGVTHYGQMLVAGNAERGAVSAGWADSWHQNTGVMALSGSGMDGEVNLRGEYSVEGHPNWGWRISLAQVGESLVLRMFNVSPEGDEEWAVEGIYGR